MKLNVKINTVVIVQLHYFVSGNELIDTQNRAVKKLVQTTDK